MGEVPPCPPGADCETVKIGKVDGPADAKTKQVVDGEGDSRAVEDASGSAGGAYSASGAASADAATDAPPPTDGKTKQVVDGEGETRMVVVETGNAELAEGLKGDGETYRIPESVAKLGSGVGAGVPKEGRETISQEDVHTQTTR